MRWLYHSINITHANTTHSIAHTVAHLIHDRTRSVNAAPSSMRSLGAFHGAEVRADPILPVSPNPGYCACCNAASLLFYHLLFSRAYMCIHLYTLHWCCTCAWIDTRMCSCRSLSCLATPRNWSSRRSKRWRQPWGATGPTSPGTRTPTTPLVGPRDTRKISVPDCQHGRCVGCEWVWLP